MKSRVRIHPNHSRALQRVILQRGLCREHLCSIRRVRVQHLRRRRRRVPVAPARAARVIRPTPVADVRARRVARAQVAHASRELDRRVVRRVVVLGSSVVLDHARATARRGRRGRRRARGRSLEASLARLSHRVERRALSIWVFRFDGRAFPRNGGGKLLYSKFRTLCAE